MRKIPLFEENTKRINPDLLWDLADHINSVGLKVEYGKRYEWKIKTIFLDGDTKAVLSALQNLESNNIITGVKKINDMEIKFTYNTVKLMACKYWDKEFFAISLQ
jgi:hypothetical protein